MSPEGVSTPEPLRFGYLRQLAHRPSEKFLEWYFRINSRGFMAAGDLDLPTDGHDYSPVPYLTVFSMLRNVPADLRAGAFIDFGSGKGRILALARKTYRRVIGVEYSAKLCRIAQHNLRDCPNVRIECCDASLYVVPDDATVFFFATPFGVPTMNHVQDAIQASLDRAPRPVAFLVYNRQYFDEAAATRPWIVKRRWVTCATDASWALYTAGEKA